MFYYPDDLPNKIYFDFIIDKLATYCESQYGRELIKNIKPSSNINEIFQEYEVLKLISNYIQTNNVFSTKIDGDIRHELEIIYNEGFAITTAMLNPLLQLLSIYKQLNKILSSKEMHLLKSKHVIFEESDYILEKLKHIWSYEGFIRDDASNELASIRRRIDSMQRNIDKRINEIAKNWQKQGIIADDANITIRDHRLVIPITPEAKDTIKGIIIDESATGQTIYVEPQEVFELNSALQRLYIDEKKEIYHILRTFTDELIPHIDKLLLIIDEIAYFDVIKSKYLWSIEYDATIPIISDIPQITLRNAYHPYLYSILKEHNKKIVPLNLTISNENRFVIISGPNAGGKSVVLLTVAIIQWMSQCAIPITASEGSSIGLFHKIFMDMGDNQSIKDELSTYASHLLNMKFIIDNADDNSLIIMDELGTGTEPIMGGTIAELVIEELYKKNSFAIITTHFHNLKLLPMKYSQMQNAAMLFDNETFNPTFILSQGIPGNSFTLEIAHKVGLPDKIIEKAKTQLGDNRIETEKLLVFLENEKRKLEEQKNQLYIAQNFVTDLIKKYQENIEFQKKKQNYLAKKTKNEIDEIFDKSNKIIENTIREIRESNADREKVKNVRKELESEKKSINEKINNLFVDKDTSEDQKTIFNVGQLVKIKLTGEIGEIIRISDNQLTLVVDNKILQINADAVEALNKKLENDTKRIKVNIVSRTENFSTTLDIRGNTVEDAINKLDKYLDQALLIGVPKVYIIHGKGYGILRKAVREYLKGFTHLLNFENEA
ncbi:MAG TPA: Smr/MutS family protein, partial [Bacteroidales bacterium]|nr:Smr/MutS family protein [Bacteroidales bacterium]HRS69248.1 Smr/MutS family protein [Bacteroidales bacterium]